MLAITRFPKIIENGSAQPENVYFPDQSVKQYRTDYVDHIVMVCPENQIAHSRGSKGLTYEKRSESNSMKRRIYCYLRLWLPDERKLK